MTRRLFDVTAELKTHMKIILAIFSFSNKYIIALLDFSMVQVKMRHGGEIILIFNFDQEANRESMIVIALFCSLTSEDLRFTEKSYILRYHYFWLHFFLAP